MFPDTYNPIFVLKTQKVVRFFHRYRIAILVCLLVLLGLGLAFSPVILSYVGYVDEFAADLSKGFLSSWLNLIGFITGIIPGLVFAKKEVDKDLSHFTPMPDRQLLNGYIFSGVFYSSLFITLLGLPFCCVYALMTADLFGACEAFVSAIFYAVLVNLFVMSFTAGAKTMTQLVVTGLMIYMLYISILSFYYVVGLVPGFLYEFYREHTFSPDVYSASAYVYWCICIPVVALVSYRLTIYHYRLDAAPPAKHCIIVGLHLFLLAALTALSFLLFGLIDFLPKVLNGETAL